MPLAVSPCFDPGVIVVGVGPAWGIDLAGGYADAAQGCYEEGGFLTATTIGRADSGEGRGGAFVAGLIGDAFVAPMVHLEDGFGHREALDAVLELRIEHHSASVEVLVVDTHGEDEVAPFAFRNGAAPWHLAACLKGAVDILKPEVAAVVHAVGEGHGGVEEGEGFVTGGLGRGCTGGEGEEGEEREEGLHVNGGSGSTAAC